MNQRDYKALRKSLVSARKAVDKAFEKVDNAMDCMPEEQWGKYHPLKGKLWDVYQELDNEIIKLDRSIIEENERISRKHV